MELVESLSLFLMHVFCVTDYLATFDHAHCEKPLPELSLWELSRMLFVRKCAATAVQQTFSHEDLSNNSFRDATTLT